MIPTELVIITNYATIVHWNVRNTFLGLIAVTLGDQRVLYLPAEGKL